MMPGQLDAYRKHLESQRKRKEAAAKREAAKTEKERELLERYSKERARIEATSNPISRGIEIQCGCTIHHTCRECSE